VGLHLLATVAELLSGGRYFTAQLKYSTVIVNTKFGAFSKIVISTDAVT